MAAGSITKRIQDIMWKDAGLSGDAQRIEQMVWLIFLKVYDSQESTWEYERNSYTSIIPEPCRWRNWAYDFKDGNALTGAALLDFVNNTLFPTLKNLPITSTTPISQTVVREVFADINQYMKDGILLRQVINVVNEIDFEDAKERHVFGQLYEEILKDLSAAKHAGEFYTPRPVTEFIISRLKPQLGEVVGDFTSGTGGFLTSALSYLEKQVKTTDDEELYQHSVIGQEWKPLPYLLCITNLLIHGIEAPNIKHGDSLAVKYNEFSEGDLVDVVAMNPPYGGSTAPGILSNFPSDLRSSETFDLFMILIMYRLKKHGRAGVILPDGFMFSDSPSKVALKTKLLKEFNLHTIIRLPKDVFKPYTDIATNILFFDKSDKPTQNTWFYRLDKPEGYKHFSKTKPILSEHFRPLLNWWDNREELFIEDSDTGEREYKSRCFSVDELLALDCNFNQCSFPRDEEEILPPHELLQDYYHQRAELEHEIDKNLSIIKEKLGL